MQLVVLVADGAHAADDVAVCEHDLKHIAQFRRAASVLAPARHARHCVLETFALTRENLLLPRLRLFNLSHELLLPCTQHLYEVRKVGGDVFLVRARLYHKLFFYNLDARDALF